MSLIMVIRTLLQRSLSGSAATQRKEATSCAGFVQDCGNVHNHGLQFSSRPGNRLFVVLNRMVWSNVAVIAGQRFYPPPNFFSYELLFTLTDIDILACIYAKKHLNKVTIFSKQNPGRSVKRGGDGVESTSTLKGHICTLKTSCIHSLKLI